MPTLPSGFLTPQKIQSFTYPHGFTSNSFWQVLEFDVIRVVSKLPKLQSDMSVTGFLYDDVERVIPIQTQYKTWSGATLEKHYNSLTHPIQSTPQPQPPFSIFYNVYQDQRSGEECHRQRPRDCEIFIIKYAARFDWVFRLEKPSVLTA